jgi:hypothetical protein
MAEAGRSEASPPSVGIHHTAQDDTENLAATHGGDSENEKGDIDSAIGRERRLHTFFLEQSSEYRRLVSLRERVSLRIAVPRSLCVAVIGRFLITVHAIGMEKC